MAESMTRLQALEQHRAGRICVKNEKYLEYINEHMQWFCQGVLLDQYYDHTADIHVFVIFHPELDKAPKDSTAPKYELRIETIIAGYAQLSPRRL